LLNLFKALKDPNFILKQALGLAAQLLNLFKALKDPNFILKQALDLAAQLLKRLFPIEGKNLST
jgi:hypothetical protein